MGLSDRDLAELEKLGGLRAAGLLTDDEFAQLKEEILNPPSRDGFAIMLLSAGRERLRLIKELRGEFDLDYKAANEMLRGLESAPVELQTFASREAADALADRLSYSGAEVQVVDLNGSATTAAITDNGSPKTDYGASTVVVRFAESKQTLNKRCSVLIAGKVVASGQHGETITLELDSPTEIQVVYGGGMGKPSMLVSPGDSIEVGWRGVLGKSYIEKVGTLGK